jgi:hypothetical protein
VARSRPSGKRRTALFGVRTGCRGPHECNGIDYRSHHFRVVRNRVSCYLLVKHGGGQERVRLDHSPTRVSQFFEPLDSTERYLLMHLLYSVHEDAKSNSERNTAGMYKQAFAEGRLKRRKRRGSNAVKVWIEPESREHQQKSGPG